MQVYLISLIEFQSFVTEQKSQNERVPPFIISRFSWFQHSKLEFPENASLLHFPYEFQWFQWNMWSNSKGPPFDYFQRFHVQQESVFRITSPNLKMLYFLKEFYWEIDQIELWSSQAQNALLPSRTPLRNWAVGALELSLSETYDKTIVKPMFVRKHS